MPRKTKIIDIPEEADVPVFDAGRDSKMEKVETDDLGPAPKLKYGKKAGKRLGLSKINGYRGQGEIVRLRAPKSVVKAKAERKAAVAGMLAEWQANSDTGHKKPARGKLRRCAHCDTELPYKLKLTAKFCPRPKRCKEDAANKRAAEAERDRVFQTEAWIAQDKADAAQRFYNYCEVAAEMQDSAQRIGRDDVIFFATHGGVVVVNDGAPLPPLRVIAYAHPVEPRRIEVKMAGNNYTTMHPDVVELLEAAKVDEGVAESATPTVASIPRSSWETRGTELVERMKSAVYNMVLNDLLTGPERRAMLYTIADSAYVQELEQESWWEFRFKGDTGTGESDDYEGIWPEPTAEQEARNANRRAAITWVDKHQNRPAYTHPVILAGNNRFGGWFNPRPAEDYAHGDLHRIDPPPKKKPVEHLFEDRSSPSANPDN